MLVFFGIPNILQTRQIEMIIKSGRQLITLQAESSALSRASGELRRRVFFALGIPRKAVIRIGDEDGSFRFARVHNVFQSLIQV
jgi:hypothetical protein